MGGNTGEIQIGSERELYKYINHQAGTSKASTINRTILGVPDYSSEVIEKAKIDRVHCVILSQSGVCKS